MEREHEIRCLQQGHLKLNSQTLSLAITTFLNTVGRYRNLLPNDAKIIFDLRIKGKLETLLVILRDFQSFLPSISDSSPAISDSE